MNDYDQFETFDNTEPQYTPQYTQPQYTENETENKNKIWLIVGIVAGVIVVILLMIVIGVSIAKNKKQNNRSSKQAGGYNRIYKIDDKPSYKSFNQTNKYNTRRQYKQTSDDIYDSSLNSDNTQYVNKVNLPYDTEEYSIL